LVLQFPGQSLYFIGPKLSTTFEPVTPSAEYKKLEAARKREERAAVRRQRELERALKEEAKRSALEQAKLEVAVFENSIDVLLSVHKDVGVSFDWLGAVSAIALSTASAQEKEGHEWLRALAHRVLSGDRLAFETALVEISTFGEFTTLGSALDFLVPDSSLVECGLVVNGLDSIPVEIKSLTSSGKLSSKPMPKARFHEIYQDHVCSCVLRVAREVFALLPVSDVIVTARVCVNDVLTARVVEQPVLSVAIPRQGLDELDFANLDPSDSMANFRCRGDAKVSRKSGEFVPIDPLKATDLARTSQRESPSLTRIRNEVRTMMAELEARERGYSQRLARFAHEHTHS
jgi:hypothetical protein